MEFEFDPEKSISNIDKHGIDFEVAQTLWNDPNLLELEAKELEEPRFLFIGKIRSRHWSAIATIRNGKIRLISVRRARQKEIELYENG
ncbi:MAG: uncharacterized DUF497 family protein [Cyclobacteriaceae bacterium]|jgi:uncharacterized DUF497 family protein